MALADHLHMGGGTITEQLVARIEALEAENAALREALVRIANRPSQMVWGEEGEVRVAIREMEEIAGAALARQTEGEW